MAKLFFSHKNSLMILILFHFFRSFAHIYIYKRFFRSAVLNVHTILTAITAFHLGCFQTSCIIYKKNVSRCKWSCLFLSLCSHLESMLKWGEKMMLTEGQALDCQLHSMYQFQSMDILKITTRKKSLNIFCFGLLNLGRSTIPIKIVLDKIKIKIPPPNAVVYEPSHVDWIKWKLLTSSWKS